MNGHLRELLLENGYLLIVLIENENVFGGKKEFFFLRNLYFDKCAHPHFIVVIQMAQYESFISARFHLD